MDLTANLPSLQQMLIEMRNLDHKTENWSQKLFESRFMAIFDLFSKSVFFTSILYPCLTPVVKNMFGLHGCF